MLQKTKCDFKGGDTFLYSLYVGLIHAIIPLEWQSNTTPQCSVAHTMFCAVCFTAKKYAASTIFVHCIT